MKNYLFTITVIFSLALDQQKIDALMKNISSDTLSPVNVFCYSSPCFEITIARIPL